MSVRREYGVNSLGVNSHIIANLCAEGITVRLVIINTLKRALIFVLFIRKCTFSGKTRRAVEETDEISHFQEITFNFKLTPRLRHNCLSSSLSRRQITGLL